MIKLEGEQIILHRRIIVDLYYAGNSVVYILVRNSAPYRFVIKNMRKKIKQVQIVTI